MAECADSTPTKSIERVCVSPSSKDQICLLCAKVVSNNDFRRKLTTSGGPERNKNSYEIRERTFLKVYPVPFVRNFVHPVSVRSYHRSAKDAHGDILRINALISLEENQKGVTV